MKAKKITQVQHHTFIFSQEKSIKKHYNKIDKSVRLQIISQLLSEKRPLHEVAAQVGLQPSTCKSIVNTFLFEGRVGKKKQRVKKIQRIEVITRITLDLSDPFKSLASQVKNISQINEYATPSKKQKEKSENDDIKAQLEQWLAKLSEFSMNFQANPENQSSTNQQFINGKIQNQIFCQNSMQDQKDDQELVQQGQNQ